MKLSVFVPIYNEQDNVLPLYEKLSTELDKIGHEYELILVNDGSVDDTKKNLDSIADRDKRVKVINFKRNFGQTAAMMAGIDYATGDVLIPID